MEWEADQSRRSLAKFFRYGWHVLEPATPLEWNWHIDAVCEHIQAYFTDWMGRQRDPDYALRFQNLIVNIPPGTAKSRIFSVYAPGWMWVHWPTWRSIYLSANPRVAWRDSEYCKTLVESDWYRQSFAPQWTVYGGKKIFKNTAGGFRQATGFLSKITGDRADFLGMDDPHDAVEVKSDKKRVAIIEKYDDSIGNRVNDLRCSLRGLIMQRLHELDLSGHLLKQGSWEHLCLPMEYVTQLPCPCPSCQRMQTSTGWKDPRAKAGELLMPKRFTVEVLAREKARLGSTGYAGQMQQWPVPAEGAIFKDYWFSAWYRRLPKMKEVWTTWDTAMKTAEENDESACVVGGLGEDGDCYILRVCHGRWETPELAAFLVAQAEWLKQTFGDVYRGDYVEDKVSGTTLMQYVRRSHPKLALIPVQVDADKRARAHGVTPLCEAGRVRLPDLDIHPDAREWRDALISQLKAFPLGGHDDIVDAFVYSLKRFMGTLRKRTSRRGKAGGTL